MLHAAQGILTSCCSSSPVHPDPTTNRPSTHHCSALETIMHEPKAVHRQLVLHASQCKDLASFCLTLACLPCFMLQSMALSV